MACNGVLTPLLSKSNPPASPKIVYPPVLKLFTPPNPTGNGCFCIFHTWLLPTSTAHVHISEAIKTDYMPS